MKQKFKDIYIFARGILQFYPWIYVTWDVVKFNFNVIKFRK